MCIVFVVAIYTILIEVKEVKRTVPPQVKGAKSDIQSSVSASDNQQAEGLYNKARNNLLDVSRWEQLAGKMSASFTLADPAGNTALRRPLQGDYIKIHLPAASADKFEWVRIEAIEEMKQEGDRSMITIRVRPSDPPRAQEETEHFFSKDATSSFSVERQGRVVRASVRGRNELPNLEQPGLKNKLRNLLISIGAMAGANYPQWKGLVNGILGK